MDYNVAIKAYGATTELVVDGATAPDPPTGPTYHYHNGSSVVTGTMHYYNGSAWVPVTGATVKA